MAIFLVALSAHAASITPTGTVTLVHVNDVMGEIEPCGCRHNPLGGVVRRFNYLKSLKQAGQPGDTLLQLDAGDLYFETRDLPPLFHAQAKVQADLLIQAMNLLNIDAFTPGEKEFTLGTDEFLKISKRFKTTILSANLKDAKGKLLFKPSLTLIRKIGGKNKRILIVGLTGNQLNLPSEVQVSDPIETAQALLKKEKGKFDIAIALTHQGTDADLALAKAAPELNWIVGGHDQAFLQKPIEVEHENSKTYVTQMSYRGQHLGKVNLAAPESYRSIEMAETFEGANPESNIVQLFKSKISALAKKEELRAEKQSEADQKLNRVPATKFQTFPKCAECHLKQFEFWRKSPHIKALETLVSAHQDSNLSCLKCHSLGLGDPKGFKSSRSIAETDHPINTTELAQYISAIRSAKSPDDFVEPTSVPSPVTIPLTVKESLHRYKNAYSPVQCEHCHGPGGSHPLGGKIVRMPNPKVCLQCHTPERAPSWYTKPLVEVLKAKMPLVTCPLGTWIEDETEPSTGNNTGN